MLSSRCQSKTLHKINSNVSHRIRFWRINKFATMFLALKKIFKNPALRLEFRVDSFVWFLGLDLVGVMSHNSHENFSLL